MSYTKVFTGDLEWIYPALFGIVYFAMAELGGFLSVKPYHFITFWPASGLFVSVLLLSDFRLWRFFISAAFLANIAFDLHHGRPLWVTFFLSAGNGIESFCGAWLIRTCISSDIALESLKDILGLTIFSALLSTTVSATIGAGVVTGFYGAGSFWSVWSVWWIAKSLGILVAAPFFLTWIVPGIFCVKPINLRRTPEAMLMIFSILFCSWSVFSEQKSWINVDFYLLLPLLIWAALRFESRGVSASGFIMTIIAVAYTSGGFGEFGSDSGLSVYQKILSLQVFLSITLFTIHVLTAVIVERKQMESALRASEKKYRTLFDNAPDGIEMLDSEGFIRECNPAFEKYVGQDRKDIVGKHTSDFFSDQSKKKLADSFLQIRQHGSSESEVNLLTREGNIIEIWRKSNALYGAHHDFSGIVAYNRNISLRKKAERELGALLMAMPAYVLIARDPECRQILGSRNLSDFRVINNGCPTDNSVVSKQFFPFIPLSENGWEMPSLKMPLQLAASRGEDFRDFELNIVFENGENRTLLGNATPLKNNHNIVTGSVAVFFDITDRKQMEDALRESEERMKLALKGSDVGIWDWDMTRDVILYDEYWADVLGVNSETKTTDLNWLYQKMHPTGITDLNNAIREYLNGSAPYFESEYQIRDAKNEWKWVWTRGKVIEFDRKRKPNRMIGVLRDITQRKQSDEMIRASLREKEILLREIHHRVKNNMQVISSLLRLQASKITDERVLNAIKDSENRVRTMSLVHETLYRSDTFGAIHFQNYLSNLAKAIYQSYAVHQKQLKIHIDTEGIKICLEHATTLGLIINELLTNSLKYAFTDRFEGEIRILARIQNRQLELVVQDNGTGIPADLDWRNTSSLGLQLVITLVENQLDGSIELDRSQGTKFTISFNHQEFQKGCEHAETADHDR